MPKDLKDFPRPPNDNGRGLHGSATIGWSGGNEGLDYWIRELTAMGIRWFKVLDDGGDSISLCQRLLDNGIFPIVRIIRKDPPPNDSPEPNPGHIGSAEEETIRRLVSAGVRYFETNNEPNLGAEWKHQAMPLDAGETAKLVALNWLFDARIIFEAGGFPGVPAISIGGHMDLIGALVALGRQEILLDGCWIAIHNYCINHPLAYPDEPVNRTGQPMTPDQYDQGPYTQWVWWNNDQGIVDPLERINAVRASGKNPTKTIIQDHSCFREFEYYNYVATKYLGRSIPILSTEGGLLIGRREDSRYPRITPEMHRDQTVAIFDFMQRQAPDYYFVAMPWLLFESPGWETDAWQSGFWKRALRDGTDGRNGVPPLSVQGVALGDHLPVLDAVKAMPNLARRLVQPQRQPVPPPATPGGNSPIVVKPRPDTVSEPAYNKYTVKPGDTLSKIAIRFGTTWQRIAELNRVVNPNVLHPGQILLVPGSLDQLAGSPVPSTVPSSPTGTDDPSAAPRPTPPVSSGTRPVPSTAPTSGSAAPANGPIKPSIIPPPPPPRPAAPKPRPAAPRVELDWDMRLDALQIGYELIQSQRDQKFWKLLKAEYLGPAESNGKHHIVYIIRDEQGEPIEGQRVWQGWPDDKTDATTNSRGEASIPLWASYSPERGEKGPYFAYVDGFASDRVTGLGLPQKRQVSFVLTWQRSSR